MYEDKQNWYYSFVRKDIEPLLPPQAQAVLEIGCGGGGTLAWLKSTKRAKWVAGIELSPDASAVARQRLDRLYQGDVDEQLEHFEPESLDLILCLDVLEHLVDPWVTLKGLHHLLKPNGQLIASLPNMRHHSVLLPLLFKGKWRYENAGIMDRTHLRFFTHQTAVDMFDQAGFELTAEKSTYAWGTWDKWKDSLTLGLFRPFLSFQYLLKVSKIGP